MAYSVYDPCEDDIEDPVCDPCTDGIELGRVRGVCFIHKSAIAALLAAPTSAAAWEAARAAGHIKVIPKTTGTFDGGSPVETAGFGDQESKVIGYKFVLDYKDPALVGNTPFYNTISKSSSYHVAFRTETQTRISDKPCTIIPKSPVEEDMSSQVIWNVQVKFSQEDHPVSFDTPAGVFECI
jgi:hypothetical protein